MEEALTFDDFLIKPRFSNVTPDTVDISTSLGKVRMEIPIMSAAMDTVTGEKMALAMNKLGGVGVIHRNMPIDEQAKIVRYLKRVCSSGKIVAAVGSTNDGRAEELVKAGADVISIDAAHGWTTSVLDAISRIVKLDVQVWGGNIVDGEAAVDLVRRGCSAVKVGIGAGSICTTRVVTGVGYPQAQAISNVYRALNKYLFDMRFEDQRNKIYDVREREKVGIIADGGMRTSGDVAKALAIGANAVMLGNMLAGTEETPSYKGRGKPVNYRGMGSKEAMTSNSKDRYMSSGKKTSEGVSAAVPYKGSVEGVIEEICGGLRSSMGYTGSHNLETFKTVEFVRMTNNGVVESRVHSVIV